MHETGVGTRWRLAVSDSPRTRVTTFTLDKQWIETEARLWAEMMNDKAQRPQGLNASDKGVAARAAHEWAHRQQEAFARGWKLYDEWIRH